MVNNAKIFAIGFITFLISVDYIILWISQIQQLYNNSKNYNIFAPFVIKFACKSTKKIAHIKILQ